MGVNRRIVVCLRLPIWLISFISCISWTRSWWSRGGLSLTEGERLKSPLPGHRHRISHPGEHFHTLSVPSLWRDPRCEWQFPRPSDIPGERVVTGEVRDKGAALEVHLLGVLNEEVPEAQFKRAIEHSPELLGGDGML